MCHWQLKNKESLLIFKKKKRKRKNRQTYFTARRPFLENAKPVGYITPHTMPTSELLRAQFSLLILPGKQK